MGACQDCCRRQPAEGCFEVTLEKHYLQETQNSVSITPAKIHAEPTGKGINKDVTYDMSPPQHNKPLTTLAADLATSWGKSNQATQRGQREPTTDMTMPRPYSEIDVRGWTQDSELLIQTPNKNLALESTDFSSGRSLKEVADIKVKAYLAQVANQSSVKLDGNVTFQGEVKDGAPCGRGVLFVSDTDIFLGIFVGTRAIYKIEHVCFRKNSYFLGLVDAKLKYHGFGMFLDYSTKESYNGEFKHGLRHGSGQQIRNGIAFMGNFADGLPCEDGSGIYVRLSDNAVINKPPV